MAQYIPAWPSMDQYRRAQPSTDQYSTASPTLCCAPHTDTVPVPPALPCQLHPSPLKRSLALAPGGAQPSPGGDWAGPGGPEEPLTAPRGPTAAFGEHAPLSPQSSVASSGSEHTEEPGGRNSFQEDGSGMKDVPSWLKSLRLHKYAALFAQMSYEEMMTLTEHHLESQNVTKGARHKIALSIQKLRERQSVLRALEKDILEGGNLWTALQELQQILATPIKAFRPPPPPGPPDGAPPEAFAAPPAPEAEPPAAPVPDGDIPGQFTRVMGKGEPPAPKTGSLWFGGGPGGSPGSRGAVQRTHSLPVHSSALLAFPQECPPPGTDLEINPTLESLCLSGAKTRTLKFEDPCLFFTLPELPAPPTPRDGVFRGGSGAVHTGCGVSSAASVRVFGGSRQASAETPVTIKGPTGRHLVADSLDKCCPLVDRGRAEALALTGNRGVEPARD
uniref:protein Smaug homolog 2 n=1 Tax=Lonchura striata TaxID=40157 RepID=UPI000B4CFD35